MVLKYDCMMSGWPFKLLVYDFNQNILKQVNVAMGDAYSTDMFPHSPYTFIL